MENGDFRDGSLFKTVGFVEKRSYLPEFSSMNSVSFNPLYPLDISDTCHHGPWPSWASLVTTFPLSVPAKLSSRCSIRGFPYPQLTENDSATWNKMICWTCCNILVDWDHHPRCAKNLRPSWSDLHIMVSYGLWGCRCPHTQNSFFSVLAPGSYVRGVTYSSHHLILGSDPLPPLCLCLFSRVWCFLYDVAFCSNGWGKCAWI